MPFNLNPILEVFVWDSLRVEYKVIVVFLRKRNLSDSENKCNQKQEFDTSVPVVACVSESANYSLLICWLIVLTGRIWTCDKALQNWHKMFNLIFCLENIKLVLYWSFQGNYGSGSASKFLLGILSKNIHLQGAIKNLLEQ